MVEGDFDLRLWRYLVPVSDRRSADIYIISNVEVADVAEGGNKGRMIALAQLSQNWDEAGRLRFFVDSDVDRFMPREYPDRITTTDGRDVESYVLSERAWSCLCEAGAGERTSDAQLIRGAVRNLLRPVGLLRILSAQQELHLPFQMTFADGSIRRFFRYHRGQCDLRLDNMLDALLDQAGIERRLKHQIHESLAVLSQQLEATEDFDVIHGKDLVSFLSWYFEVPNPIAAGLVALSISTCLQDLLRANNIHQVKNWVCR